MRLKLLIGAAVGAFVATPAFADVDVSADIDVDKDIEITEEISIDTDVNLDVSVEVDAEKFAESIAIGNQSNYGNEACSNCAEKTDLIAESANGNVGIVSVNQSTGNFNNQGTLISSAIDVEDDNPEVPGVSGFAEAQASVDQRNGTPEAFPHDNGSSMSHTFEGDGNTVKTVNILFRDATMVDSYNGNIGLAYGNQSSGNNANQINVLSLAFSLDDSGVAMSEADLGQVNANNFVGESASEGQGDANDIGIDKSTLVANSLNGNVGIVGVNQTVGNMSNQANVVSIAAVGQDLPTF